MVSAKKGVTVGSPPHRQRMVSVGGMSMLSVDSTGSDGSIDVSITQLDQCAAETHASVLYGLDNNAEERGGEAVESVRNKNHSRNASSSGAV
ncbi:hypothetical protein F2P81_008353 [Scophthalmus maximus]|uniref:Uncharacterized protein n=1 Tax=Scophthalmus maximus TaxID=52904 RepID=A0A6A4T720_SCOMX|nr:hypothetical protein F2P81_008353 [Scophthalmus maximus]